MKLRNELTKHHFTNILNGETICNCNTIFFEKKKEKLRELLKTIY